MDPNWIALRVAKKTLEMNGFPGVTVEPLDYPLPAQAYHTVVIDLPKGRKLARRWLVEAWGALQLDGELYLAGANLAGIRSVIQDAGDVFGNATVLAYRKGCRVARMLKRSIEADSSDPTSSGLTLNPPVAWAVQPGLERGSWVEFITSACGEYLLLHSLPGVFSFDRVDEGTGLLLQQLSRDQVHEKLVLDFGCGYGLIGMAAARLGAAWVELIDVDLSAVASARDNLSLNGISNAQVRPSDVLEAVRSEHFDLILSNPPFHSGKEVEYSIARTFIAHAWHLLNRGGRLELVANRFIRYDQLMMEIFGNVRRVAETGKFYVLESAR